MVKTSVVTTERAETEYVNSKPIREGGLKLKNYNNLPLKRPKKRNKKH